MLFIIFLQSGAYGLISNSLGSDCLPGKQVDKLIGNLNAKQKEEYLKKHRVCSLSSITKLSLANKRHNVMLSEPQGYMNILTIFVIILILQAMRYYQRKVTLECDAAAVTASDYTVVVKGIPNNVSGGILYIIFMLYLCYYIYFIIFILLFYIIIFILLYLCYYIMLLYFN